MIRLQKSTGCNFLQLQSYIRRLLVFNNIITERIFQQPDRGFYPQFLLHILPDLFHRPDT